MHIENDILRMLIALHFCPSCAHQCFTENYLFKEEKNENKKHINCSQTHRFSMFDDFLKLNLSAFNCIQDENNSKIITDSLKWNQGYIKV